MKARYIRLMVMICLMLLSTGFSKAQAQDEKVFYKTSQRGLKHIQEYPDLVCVIQAHNDI